MEYLWVMTISGKHDPSRNDSRHGGRSRLPLALAVCLAAAAVIATSIFVYRGCRKEFSEAEKRQKEEKKEKEKKKKPKPDLEIGRLATRPCNPERLASWYKPGHWTSVALAARANNIDFHGELSFAATDANGRPLPLVATPFDLTVSRKAFLAKNERHPKMLASVLYVPPSTHQPRARCRLRRRGGQTGYEGPFALMRMPSYQYHFVVLARSPGRYAYLQATPSIAPPSDPFYAERLEPFYRVALLPARRRVPLPSGTLCWTSVACVLWDDVQPDTLDPDQADTLLDWLHWGGQLIVSGPRSLDNPPEFLVPYLAATASETRELGEADFRPLSQWAAANKTVPPLVPPQPLAGVKLDLDPRARFIPGSGDLLAERRVGRGRVVVSAFPLGSSTVTSWRGRDELLNAFLLHHPPREFDQALREVDQAPRSEKSGIQVWWVGADLPRTRQGVLDARLISNLRYFSRDAGVGPKRYAADLYAIDPRYEEPDVYGGGFGGDYGDDYDYLEEPPPGPGVAAWNDFSPVAGSARNALTDAARIEIPKRSFVVWVLAGYLLVLVPVNWTVFRVLGRVEWAWAAAPVIAITGTLVVIRAAQLDIGFARSRTEVAVVELMAGYPRAHVTRYSALYTSLTTTYDVSFDDPGAQVQPFPAGDDPGRQFAAHQTLDYRHAADICLSGFRVRSNDTGMMHTEQMVDLAGTLTLRKTPDAIEVVNGTGLTLHDAGVIWKDAEDTLRVAWLGTLGPKGREAKRPVHFLHAEQDRSGLPVWQKERPAQAWTLTNPADGELNLRELIDQAQQVAELEPGEMRLIAGLDQEIPGQKIDPPAPQVKQAGVLVAHLQFGFGRDPRPDTNSYKKPKKATDYPPPTPDP